MIGHSTLFLISIHLFHLALAVPNPATYEVLFPRDPTTAPTNSRGNLAPIPAEIASRDDTDAPVSNVTCATSGDSPDGLDIDEVTIGAFWTPKCNTTAGSGCLVFVYRTASLSLCGTYRGDCVPIASAGRQIQISCLGDDGRVKGSGTYQGEGWNVALSKRVEDPPQ